MSAPSQLANFVQTTLSSSATSGTVTLNVVSVAGWPTVGNFALRIDDASPATTYEIVLATAVNVGANQVTVVRGQEGTTGIAHAAGAAVGNDLTAAMLLNAFAGGVLATGYVKVTATQSTITTITDATGLIAYVTVAANRLIRVRGHVLMGNTLTTGQGQLYIVEGQAGAGGTQLQVATANFAIAALNVFIIAEVILQPAAGNHAYKLQVAATTGTSTMVAASNAPAELVVEDIGPV